MCFLCMSILKGKIYITLNQYILMNIFVLPNVMRVRKMKTNSPTTKDGSTSNLSIGDLRHNVGMDRI